MPIRDFSTNISREENFSCGLGIKFWTSNTQSKCADYYTIQIRVTGQVNISVLLQLKILIFTIFMWHSNSSSKPNSIFDCSWPIPSSYPCKRPCCKTCLTHPSNLSFTILVPNLNYPIQNYSIFSSKKLMYLLTCI